MYHRCVTSVDVLRFPVDDAVLYRSSVCDFAGYPLQVGRSTRGGQQQIMKMPTEPPLSALYVAISEDPSPWWHIDSHYCTTYFVRNPSYQQRYVENFEVHSAAIDFRTSYIPVQTKNGTQYYRTKYNSV